VGKKKKKAPGAVFLLLLFLAVILLGYIGYRIMRPTRYDAFGISVPAGFSIHGIDVSRFQERIDWDEVKSMRSQGRQIGFTFIKATEGRTRVDEHFRRNWDHAHDAGLHRGAYHFFLADRSPSEQAGHFIKTVRLLKGDLPPVLDVEETMGETGASIRRGVKEWLQLIEAHYGVRPIIYTNIAFYERHLGSEFDEYPLWVAHYWQEDRPRISRKWLFWQHSEDGQVNGIHSTVDFNVFNGDSSDFAALLIR
jgi:lysozyme